MLFIRHTSSTLSNFNKSARRVLSLGTLNSGRLLQRQDYLPVNIAGNSLLGQLAANFTSRILGTMNINVPETS